MNSRFLWIIFSTVAIALVCLLGAFTPAQAGWYTLNISSDTSEVIRNSPTPPMVITVSSFTPGPSGFSTVSIDFRGAGGSDYWTWKNGCTGSGLTLASCGISSIKVGGATQIPTAVEFNSPSRVVQITLAQTFTATTTIEISLSAGALTTPDVASGAVSDIFLGPYVPAGNGVGMDDSGMTGIIYINSVVTFHPAGATGSDVTQTGSYNRQLTSNSYSRNGFTFAGWATSPGSNTVTYNDSANYNFASNMDLYAVWTPVASSPTPTPTASPTSTPTTTIAASTPIETSNPVSRLAETATYDPTALEVAIIITLSGLFTLVINRRKLFKK